MTEADNRVKFSEGYSESRVILSYVADRYLKNIPALC